MTENNEAPVENTEAQAEPKPAKVEREKANGVTKPLDGTTTGSIWTAASALSAKLQRPVLMDELKAAMPADVNRATISTQYNKWCTFYGVDAAARKAIRDTIREAKKAAEKAEKDAAKAAAAEAKAAEGEAPVEETEE